MESSPALQRMSLLPSEHVQNQCNISGLELAGVLIIRDKGDCPSALASLLLASLSSLASLT